MKFPSVILAAFFAVPAVASPGGFPIVENGKTAAAIAVPEGDHPARFAAGQFAYWIGELTGVKPQIKCIDPGECSSLEGRHVLVGRAFAERHFPNDAAFLGDSEGFAVRTLGLHLHVFGGTGVGALFGCYDLLEKNSDIIWPCFDPECDRIFTRTNSFIVKTGYREKPAIAKRLVMHDRSARAQHYFLRNRAYTNWEYHRFKSMGIVDDDFACHNIGTVFRDDEIRKSKPEWFGLYRGKRMMNPGGFDGNICYSRLDSADWYADKFLDERLATTTRNGPYGIGAEDNNMLCECEKCLAPIKLPDGRTLTLAENEELFRSTQFFLWINRCAERIKEKRPDVKLETIAYMYGQMPPAVNLCDNLTVQYAPIGKNMKRDYFAKGNEKQKDWLVEWSERCSELAFFEYWGDGAEFPRPISSILATDIPFMLRHKTTNVNSEWTMENDKFGKQYVSALEFWTVYRMMWNPERPLESLRQEFFDRAFREGAKDMRIFYDSVRDAWYADASTSFYYDNPIRLTGYYFLGNEELGAKCFGALSNAYASVKHPVAKIFIGKIKSAMEGYLAEARKTFVKGGSATIPFIDDASIAAVEGIAWSRALVIGKTSGLKQMFKMKEKKETDAEVSVAHDGKNLYVRFKSEWYPEAFKSGPESLWSNEHWEMFIQSDKSNPEIPYWQFAVDPSGKQASNIGYNECKTPPKWTAETKREGNRWSAVCTFPFAEIGIKDGVAPRIHFMHHSQVDSDKCDWRSWHGYGVHDTASFTDCALAPKE